MARAFDESQPYQHLGSSMSSQTSLAGGRVYYTQTESGSVPTHGDFGSSWHTPYLTSPPAKRNQQKRPKIKTSASHGALSTQKMTSIRLHRRGNSAASNTTSPTSPTFVPDFLQQSSISKFPASPHADPYVAREGKSSSKSKVKIKPLLRKYASQENNAIDLSRSAAENEALNMYASSDINVAPIASDSQRHGYHNRGISATSQLSGGTTSSTRYNTNFPRQTSGRPYTPPTGPSSYKTSLESDNTSVPLDSHSRQTSQASNTPIPYAPLPTASSRHQKPSKIHTSSKSISSSHPGTPSSLRFPTAAETTTNLDITSPTTTRSSLESRFTKRSGRSRSNTLNTDPASLAPAVQAARAKFREQEAAKERKYAEAAQRRQEKEGRREERKRAKSNAASEKEGLKLQEARTEMAEWGDRGLQQRQGQRRVDSSSAVRSQKGEKVRGQWSLFWFRLKTVWLRLKRRMGGRS